MKIKYVKITNEVRMCCKTSNFEGSHTGSSLTEADSNPFLNPWEINKTNLLEYLKDIFVFYHDSICCVYLLESPHRGDSNEYTQYTFIL